MPTQLHYNPISKTLFFSYGSATIDRNRALLAVDGTIRGSKVSGHLLKRKYAADKFWADRAGRKPSMSMKSIYGGDREAQINRAAANWHGTRIEDRGTLYRSSQG